MVKSVKEILSDAFWIMPATPEYKAEGIPYITSKNIKNGYIDFGNVNYISEEDYEAISKNRPIKNGDILISMIGTLGETAEVTDQDGKFYGQNMFLVRLNSETINKRYFLNYFQSGAVKRALVGSQNQSTQKYLKANHIEDLQIPVLSIEEQAEIANRLDLLSLVITQRKTQLTSLDELIKARFVEMFGTFPNNEKGWPTGKIRDLVADVRYGSSRKAADGENGQYPYLRMNNITYNGELDLKDIKTIDIPKNELPKCSVQRGDVLFNRTNSKELVGKTCVYNRDELMVLAGFIIRIRLNGKALPEFVSAFLNTDFSKQMLLGMCKAAIGQANINATEMQNIGIYIPPVEEQNRFIEFKYQVDKSKVAVQKALDETQLLFDSLMQEYFG